MRNTIGIVLLAVVVLTNCTQKVPKTKATEKKAQLNPAQELAKLDSLLSAIDHSSQYFTFPSHSLISIKGKKGTLIRINPANLETENGASIGTTIEVEIKELFNRKQLLKANVQTVSDGRLLVSGGSVYIRLTSNQQPLRLKAGKTYTLQLPIISSEPMSLFYGERDSLNTMNWKSSDIDFAKPAVAAAPPIQYEAVIVSGQGRYTDTSSVALKNYGTQEYESIRTDMENLDKLKQPVYRPVFPSKLGWINCDRVLLTNIPKTSISCSLTNTMDSISAARVYMVYSDLNALVGNNDKFLTDGNAKLSFADVPVGSKVRFIAVGYKQGQLLVACSPQIVIARHHAQSLTMKAMSVEAYEKLLDTIHMGSGL